MISGRPRREGRPGRLSGPRTRRSVPAQVALILLSTGVLVFGNPTCGRGLFRGALGALEAGACAVFSAEVFVRAAVARSPRALVADPYVWFDALAVLPCWLALGRAATRPSSGAGCGPVVSFLRTLRTFRLLKLARRYEGSVVIVRALERSLPALARGPRGPLFARVPAAAAARRRPPRRRSPRRWPA